MKPNLLDSTSVRETIAATDGIVVVDVSAEWCAPCRMLQPVVEQLADESPDLTLVEIDVDASPDFARDYDVMSFPTLLFFADGQLVRRLIGARGLASLREEVEQIRASTKTVTNRS